MYYDTIANTTKPVHGPGVQTAREVRAVAELARIACPEGTVTIGISPLSPLGFPDDVVEAIVETASPGIAVGAAALSHSRGHLSPVHRGRLAQQNAEVLASIVLAELTRPGPADFLTAAAQRDEPAHRAVGSWALPKSA